MRKYIIGALFGFLIAFAFSAHAEVVNMFGKVVDGSFPLQINGQKAEKDAISIEGTSYIPVRSAAEIFGYDVSFIDSQVILKKKEGDVKMNINSGVISEEDRIKIDKSEAEKQENLIKLADIEAKSKQEQAEFEARKQFGIEQDAKIAADRKAWEEQQNSYQIASLKLVMNSKEVKPDAFYKKGTTYLLSVRMLAEATGADVTLDETTKQMIFKLDKNILKLTLNSTTGYLNDRQINLETSPVIFKDVTLVPVRIIVEALGGKVDQTETTLTITK
ncbi:copper amine oxidase N-terminal domain-containing protein [Paenibacillus sp. WQ 127069]|uniref:Copper amine oxidase N-terminal domain-containing protein n=1 Tax=Paenibacillus baimaensis TaxID=2982185 RepID=A0ABT2UTK8_9BACL|nr:copper amine oxidase N-terminal domain-containing protein [Paenibacillus sp. WQ 127069]MCU6797989.1 copper amine oxidase N-terminal domain-containing protein [Paenibacillus sp. WQ 127069]